MKILVVDDEPDFLATCARLLALLGHEAVTTTDPLEAIARIEQGGIHLVITDLRLGPLGGQVVLQRATGTVPPLPVIVVTGHPAPEIVQMVRRAGATLLPKPVAPGELKQSIDRVAAR